MGPTVGRRAFAVVLAAALLACIAPFGRAAEPITIGFADALTGGLAVVGKSGILAAQIWAEEVNAKGGLLGRPVKLVFYDNQSNAANVPGIYTKLLDVDHVDLIISGYATNMVAPAMPIAMAHDKLFVSLFCLAVNSEFHYPRYFSMLPTGPDPKHAFSHGYFDIAMAQSPKPQTIAIVAADAEFARNASDGARDNAKEAGLRIVYDGTYPLMTTDYTPIVRAVRATNPDVIYVASYPTDTAGILRAANEVGLKAQLFGGNMVGLQTTALKTQLGPLLNGIVINENWLPARRCSSLVSWNSSSGTRRRRRLKVSIRSAISCHHGRLRGCRCWRRRSMAHKALTMASSPIISVPTHSTPSSAMWHSARTANGRRHGSSGHSSRISRGMISSSSGIQPRRWSCCRPSSNRAR